MRYQLIISDSSRAERSSSTDLNITLTLGGECGQNPIAEDYLPPDQMISAFLLFFHALLGILWESWPFLQSVSHPLGG